VKPIEITTILAIEQSGSGWPRVSSTHCRIRSLPRTTHGRNAGMKSPSFRFEPLMRASSRRERIQESLNAP
jgi:hypothetical protein